MLLLYGVREDGVAALEGGVEVLVDRGVDVAVDAVGCRRVEGGWWVCGV